MSGDVGDRWPLTRARPADNYRTDVDDDKIKSLGRTAM